MRLVDTHCHLDMLDGVDEVLARGTDAGIVRFITIGVDAASSEWAVACAEANPGRVFATVGLHPHDAKDRTDQMMARFAELAANPLVVGVGEAGLDYHYDNSPRDVQRAVFAEHVALAKAAHKTLVIHSRSAWDDTFATLEACGLPERTVFHCFSGGPQEAARAIDMGATLSFSGVVTFRNAQDLRLAAAATPLDRIVVETDAPFLTPVPHRGTRNEPARVIHCIEEIAAVKGLEPEVVAQATTENACRAFGFSLDAGGARPDEG